MIVGQYGLVDWILYALSHEIVCHGCSSDPQIHERREMKENKLTINEKLKPTLRQKLKYI